MYCKNCKKKKIHFECHNIYCLDDKQVQQYYAQVLHSWHSYSVLLHCKFHILDSPWKISAGNYRYGNKFHTHKEHNRLVEVKMKRSANHLILCITCVPYISHSIYGDIKIVPAQNTNLSLTPRNISSTRLSTTCDILVGRLQSGFSSRNCLSCDGDWVSDTRVFQE